MNRNAANQPVATTDDMVDIVGPTMGITPLLAAPVVQGRAVIMEAEIPAGISTGLVGEIGLYHRGRMTGPLVARESLTPSVLKDAADVWRIIWTITIN